jgi:hypothetical protein
MSRPNGNGHQNLIAQPGTACQIEFRLIQVFRPSRTFLLQNRDLAIDAKNLRHFLFELSVAAFQVIAHLVRFQFLLVEDLAHRALDEVGKTLMPCRRPMLCQEPRRPQLMRIAQFLCLATGQRDQPRLGFACDRRLLTGSGRSSSTAKQP